MSLKSKLMVGCCILPLMISSAVKSDEVVSFTTTKSEQFISSSDAKSGLWDLLSNFETQESQAFCGIASSVVILNSLNIKPSIPAPSWYPFERFNQTNFFNMDVLKLKAPNVVNMEGVTLDELTAILNTYDVTATAYHATDDFGLYNFRKTIMFAMRDSNSRVILNFHRKPLGQSGGGHHSPIAAYDPKSDRFLVLDVARYKFVPYWVTAEDLWKAANTMDNDAKAMRGIIVIEKGKKIEVGGYAVPSFISNLKFW